MKDTLQFGVNYAKTSFIIIVHGYGYCVTAVNYNVSQSCECLFKLVTINIIIIFIDRLVVTPPFPEPMDLDNSVFNLSNTATIVSKAPWVKDLSLNEDNIATKPTTNQSSNIST